MVEVCALDIPKVRFFEILGLWDFDLAVVARSLSKKALALGRGLS
ncbi:hypothetical protein BH11ARM1_BH11ARM1_14720 [soil metagenome]